METYQKWLVEKVDELGPVLPQLVDDDDVEDVVEELGHSGADCYVSKVTIH